MNKFIKASLIAAMLAAPIMADEEFGGIGVTIYQIRDGVKVASTHWKEIYDGRMA